MVKRSSVIAALCLYTGGCCCRPAVPLQAPREEIRVNTVLYRRPLELRILTPKKSLVGDPLVIYATGDGGWRGLDDQVFQWIAGLDYPIVGFSSKSYLSNMGYLSDTDTTSARRLAGDYRRIIDFAEKTLSIPATTRIILAGNSRGAGLSVVAAGQGDLKLHLAGLLAIALTKEEEHVVRYRRLPRKSPAETRKLERVEIKTYEYLPRLAEFPVAVIQSEHDRYLPASAARTLFGPDADLRRFRAVSAKSHSFRGGCDDLFHEIDMAMSWINVMAPTSIQSGPNSR